VLVFWRSWQSIGTTLAIATVGYAGLLVILRVSGKRTLSKLNAFDWIVTVALGSTLATTVLSPDVSAVDGLLALGVLVTLQFVVTFASVRIDGLRAAVKSSPTRVVSSGVMQRDAMQRERITEDEIYQAVRAAGMASLRDLDVVLETSGRLSVVRMGDGPAEALDNVR
jgi:uncharacterized membrane protein YcaP (DUF421 family)